MISLARYGLANERVALFHIFSIGATGKKHDQDKGNATAIMI